MASDDSAVVYEARYQFRHGPIAGVLATLVAVGMLVGVDYFYHHREKLPMSSTGNDPTIMSIMWWMCAVLIFFGVYGTVRSTALAIRRRVAIRVDQYGVTTTGKAVTDRGARRRSRMTPWGSFDIITTEYRVKSPNGAGDTHFMLRRTHKDGTETLVGRDHHVYGHGVDLEEIKRIARLFSPDVRVETVTRTRERA